MRIAPRHAAQAGGWLSLLVIALHSALVYVAFGSRWPVIPIDDPFVRWELLNLECIFALLVVVISVLAIHHAGSRQPDGRTARVATTVLAVLWTVDALYAAVAPMPLPAAIAWMRHLVPILIGALALVCWYSVFAADPPDTAAERGP